MYSLIHCIKNTFCFYLSCFFKALLSLVTPLWCYYYIAVIVLDVLYSQQTGIIKGLLHEEGLGDAAVHQTD